MRRNQPWISGGHAGTGKTLYGVLVTWRSLCEGKPVLIMGPKGSMRLESVPKDREQAKHLLRTVAFISGMSLTEEYAERVVPQNFPNLESELRAWSCKVEPLEIGP